MQPEHNLSDEELLELLVKHVLKLPRAHTYNKKLVAELMKRYRDLRNTHLQQELDEQRVIERFFEYQLNEYLISRGD